MIPKLKKFLFAFLLMVNFFPLIAQNGSYIQGLVEQSTYNRVLVQNTEGTLAYRNLANIFASNGNWSLTGNPNTNPTTNFLGTTDLQPLNFRTNNTEQMTILSNGNVGIGTTTPSSYGHGGTNRFLEILNSGTSQHSQSHLILSSNTTSANSTIGTITFRIPSLDWASTYTAIAGFTEQTNKSIGLTFVTQGVERMTINSSGNVGINTTTPLTTLDVNGGTNPIIRVAGSSFPSTPYQGAYLGWNALTGGTGETNFINHQGLGTGGFAFMNTSGTGTVRNTLMFLNGNGNLGIGTTSPTQAKLVVVGGGQLNGLNTGQFRQFKYYYTGLGPGTTTNWGEIGIFATNDIVTSASITAVQNNIASDERIKDIKGKSETRDDLAILEKLDVVDYKMKDKVQMGDKTYKKVIAQQVKEVYPNAITQRTDFVPNIYQVVNKIEKISSNDYKLTWQNDSPTYNKDILTGKIKLITEKGEIIAHITNISSNIVEIRTEEAILNDISELFVYGVEVNDFLTVDYDALSMLNISSTQELSKQLKDIQSKYNSQASELQEKTQELAELRAKIEAIELKIKNIN